MIDGLTADQSHFIETYVLVPRVLRKKRGQRKRDDAVREFRSFNVNRDVVRERIARIAGASVRSALLEDLDRAGAIIEANPKKPDFDGGRAYLAQVNETARLRLRQQEAREKYEAATARVAKLGKSRDHSKRKGYDRGLDNQDEIDLVWAYVQDKYVSGMEADNAGDLDSSVKAMDRLDGLIDSAETIKPFRMRTGALEDAVAEAQEGLQAAVQDARRDLTGVSNALLQLKDRATRAFTASAIPADIDALIATVDTRLDEAADADPSGLPARAAAARVALAAATDANVRRIADKTAWLAQDRLFHRTWDLLSDHAQKDEAVHVKPKLDILRGDYSAAEAKAEAGDFAGATADVAPLLPRAAALLSLADDYAHFLHVETARQTMLDALRDPTDFDGVPQIKTAIQAALQLMIDARAARDAGNMADATARLDAIPAAIAIHDSLQVALGSYNRKWNEADAALTEFGNHPADVTGKVTLDLQLLEATRDAAEALVMASDLSGAAHKLQAITGYVTAVKNKIDLIAEFNVEEPLFQARLDETRLRDGIEGRVAIEDYYRRLQDDAARIVAHTTGPRKEFGLALDVARALKGVHADKMALADLGRDYLALRKQITDEIARLQGGAAGGALATEAIAVASATLAQAANTSGGGDWQGAVWLLEDGERELQQGTRAADIAADIDGLQEPANLDGIAGDFDAALGEFTKAQSHVEALDADGIFAGQLRQAERTAQSGRAFLTQAQPDPAKAREKIEAGIAACKEVGKHLTQRDLYTDALAAVERERGAIKSRNEDKCIETELDSIKAHMKAAAKLVKSPGLDFEGAVAELTEAGNLVVTAIQACAAYRDVVRPAQKAIKNTLRTLEKEDVAPGMGDEVARLRQIGDDMKAAFENRDLTAARGKATEAEGLIGPYLNRARTYKDVAGLYKQHITDTRAMTLDHPAVPDLVARMRAVIASVDSQMADHAYWSAGVQIFHVAPLAERIRGVIADFPAWETALDGADTSLRNLEDRDDPALGPAHERIEALRIRFDDATKEAGYHNYGGALRRLEGFTTECGEVDALVDLYDRYLAARDDAIAAITRLGASDTSAIAPLFARLEGKRDNALGKAAAFDFDAAIALFKELLSDCATAGTTLDAQAAFAEVMDQIKLVTDGDTDDLKMSLKATQATFAQLRAKPSALLVKTRLDAVQTLLQQATHAVETDFATARATVAQALDDCRDIAVEMGQYDQLCDAADLARKLAAVLAGHPQYGAERDAIDHGLNGVEQAMNGVRMQNAPRPAATRAVEAAITEFRRLRNVLDDHAAFTATRDQIRFDLNNQLEKHKARHVARADIAGAEKALAEAETQAGARDYGAATAQLKTARERIGAGLMRLKASANEVPAQDEIKAFLGDKAGIALLDEVINNLEPAIQRKVIAEVFKARFGCDLTLSKARFVQVDGEWVADVTADDDLDSPAPNLRRFYKEMSKLPPKDTLDNESMLIFEHRGGVQTGSYFDSDDKVVAMHEGEAKTSAVYAISQEVELGAQEDRYTCKDGEPVSYFSWNALHEVAHAVDDRMGFMDRHDGEADDGFGGWVAHRSHVMPVARAIAGEFNFDTAYVAEYMSMGEGSAPPVPEPMNCDAEEWNRRRRDCEIWVDRARVGNDPWATRIAADNCTIGGRVYHEAYKNDWVSYLASARAKGVSGYQFRAPGEWFAELYAAYHSGKLKDTHPASDWLKDL